MADNTATNWASVLFEMKGPMQDNYSKEHVLLAELSGVGDRDNPGRFTQHDDISRDTFSGSKVRVPIFLNPIQAAGPTSESGTLNVPINEAPTQAEITLARVTQPASLTIDLEENSISNSSVSAVARLVKDCRVALADTVNDMMNSTQGLLETVKSATGSGTLVIDVGTGANFDRLYPGRLVDIATRSNGANPGNGRRRLIASIQESAGTITVSTTGQASDGDSGTVTFSANEGVYIDGSIANWNVAVAGLEDVAATTGTFENINKATVAGWQGTDGRNGVTTTAALSAPMLDGGTRRGRRSGKFAWDFGIGDPAAIDIFKQSLYSQVRYDPQTSTLKSGFQGIVYDGAQRPIPLVKEPAHGKGKLKLVDKESLQVYGRSKGPEFIDDDGAIFRRFTRVLPKEMWLLDRLQLGALRCSTCVFFSNLAVS